MDDQQHRQQQLHLPTDAIRSILPDKAPSSSQMLALVVLVPIAAFLLFLSGITLTGSLIGLAVSTPVFIIFSPVLVPAALFIALAVGGFLMSGAFGITALSSLSWMASNLRRLRDRLPGQIEQVKGRVQETAGQVGQKTKEAGQALQSKAQEGGEAHEGGREQEGGEAHEGGKAQERERSGGGEAQKGGKAQDRERSGGGEAQKGGKAQERGKSGGGGGEAQKGGKAQERGGSGEGGEAQKGGRAEEGSSPHSRKK